MQGVLKFKRKFRRQRVNSRGARIFQKSGSHLKIPGSRTVTLGKFHNKDLQTSGGRPAPHSTHTHTHTHTQSVSLTSLPFPQHALHYTTLQYTCQSSKCPINLRPSYKTKMFKNAMVYAQIIRLVAARAVQKNSAKCSTQV